MLVFLRLLLAAERDVRDLADSNPTSFYVERLELGSDTKRVVHVS